MINDTRLDCQSAHSSLHGAEHTNFSAFSSIDRNPVPQLQREHCKRYMVFTGVFLWRNSPHPQWARASSLSRLHDHK